MARTFVLLDRDGTLIVERHYLSDPAQVDLLPGAAAGLRKMMDLGLGLAVVSNQSGVGRGYFDLARLEAIHQRMRELLAADQVRLDGIYVCPHVPEDKCACRKPGTGMVTAAAAELGFVPAETFVIGDKPCDIELGQAVGAKTFLVRTGYGSRHEQDATLRPDHVVDNLLEAANIIAQHLSTAARSPAS